MRGREPSPSLPIGVCGVWHYRVRKRFRLYRIGKLPTVHLYWFIDGRGTIVLDGKPFEIGPRQFAMIYPDEGLDLRGSMEEWEYAGIAVDGPFAVPVAAELGLSPGVYDAGACPLNLVRRLMRAVADPSYAAELQAGALAYDFLSRAATSRKVVEPDAFVKQAIEILQTDWADTELNVNALARRMATHPSALCRKFTAATGRSPLAYLTDLRVRNALALLHQTELSVAQIASRCGFNDPRYFARVIRRQCGHSPRELRKQG